MSAPSRLLTIEELKKIKAAARRHHRDPANHPAPLLNQDAKAQLNGFIRFEKRDLANHRKRLENIARRARRPSNAARRLGPPQASGSTASPAGAGRTHASGATGRRAASRGAVLTRAEIERKKEQRAKAAARAAAAGFSAPSPPPPTPQTHYSQRPQQQGPPPRQVRSGEKGADAASTKVRRGHRQDHAEKEKRKGKK